MWGWRQLNESRVINMLVCGSHQQQEIYFKLQNTTTKRLQKACRVACASFALDDFVGTLAPTEGKLLYMSRVDPILTFASEMVLEESSVSSKYIRRLLQVQVGHRSVVATLPQVLLAIPYLRVVYLPDNHLHIADLNWVDQLLDLQKAIVRRNDGHLNDIMFYD